MIQALRRGRGSAPRTHYMDYMVESMVRRIDEDQGYLVPHCEVCEVVG